MSQFLTEEANFNRIFLFTDDSPDIRGKSTEPFRATLLRVLRQIFTDPFMKDGDNFWFFFSGHGIPHQGQDYLMPLDGDPEDIENTGISTNTITNYLRSCGADNAVMILDACRSGGKKSGEGIGRQTEADARQTGVISFFSCSPDQYSYELEAISQGAFTHALIEGVGIRGKCATVERLNQYLEHRVPELVNQQLGDKVRQAPYTIAEPLNRSHLILMSQYASLADIATLKNDAYRAQNQQDWDLAQRLWIRVNAAASGQDMDAIEALQNLGIQRHTQNTPPQPPSPQIPKTTESTKAPTTRSTPTPTTTPSPRSKPSSDPALRPEQPSQPRISPKTQQFTSAQRKTSLPPKPISSTSPSAQFHAFPRRQLLKWAAPVGVGIVVVTIASQFLGDQSQQPSSGDSPGDQSQQPSPKDSPDTSSPPLPKASTSNLNSSPTAIDYSKLEDFLKAEQWQEADQETANLMLKVANREQQGWLDSNSLENFPCDVLSQIDRLWVDHSGGKFGFSIQKKIYIENCGGKPDGQHESAAWYCFADAVGWRVNQDWLSYSQMTFDTSAPKGHLPVYGGLWRGGMYLWMFWFFSRAKVCDL